MMRRVAIAVLAMVCAHAAARDDTGRLDRLRAPNAGKPAIVQAGDRIRIEASEACEIFAVQNERRVPLELVWSAEQGMQTAHAIWPDGFKEGAVALEAVANGHTDREERAVYVHAEAPSTYFAAIVGDVALSESDPESQNALRRLINALNESPAVLAVFAGKLTAQGTEQEFASLVEILETATLPTVVVCGPEDSGHFASYFGEPVFAFTCFEDGFVVTDAAGKLPMWDPAGQAGDLQRLRRAIKPQRWSVGFGYQYTPRMGMRAQLALFVDDPLDRFFISAWDDAGEESAGPATPWNTTVLTPAPAVASGTILLVQFRPGAIEALAPRSIASEP